RQIDGGLGIMLDDIIAATFAIVIVAALPDWLLTDFTLARTLTLNQKRNTTSCWYYNCFFSLH
ncbi:MAG: hypothetical protein ACTS8P_02040, partial [Arsenophonus sp. NC-XBC3-MAG3]